MRGRCDGEVHGVSRRIRCFYAFFTAFLLITGVAWVIDGDWYVWLMIADALMMAVGVVRLAWEQRRSDR